MSFCRYEGLGIREIRQYLDENHPEVYAYLPEPNIELPKTPKQWIVNVVASVVKDEFLKWVEAQVKARHEKVSVKKDIMIAMDQEMAAIFHASTAVSSKWLFLVKILIYLGKFSQQGSISQSSPSWKQKKKDKAANQG